MIEGRAQLVTHAGKEFALCPVRCLRGHQRVAQAFLGANHLGDIAATTAISREPASIVKERLAADTTIPRVAIDVVAVNGIGNGSCRSRLAEAAQRVLLDARVKFSVVRLDSAIVCVRFCYGARPRRVKSAIKIKALEVISSARGNQTLKDEGSKRSPLTKLIFPASVSRLRGFLTVNTLNLQ